MGEALIGALLLAVNLAALWEAATRLVSRVAPAGLERLLASAVTVASAAVIEALALGTIELGTNPIALTAASIGLWLAARAALPAAETAPAAELAGWYGGLPERQRLAAGAGAGLFAAWCAWILAEPALDIDGVQYHLPESVAWIHNGVPGSIETYLPGFPVGNYPVTNEVLVAWAGGIGSNIAFPLLWAPLSALLLALAFVAGTRRFGAGAAASVVGALVVIGLPIAGDAATRIGTDLAATTWLTLAVVLAFAASDRERSPLLLAFAILALGLAVGTKTSTAPLGLIALCVAAWRMRDRLPSPVPIVASVLAAGAVGGVWYLRNLFTHGSPLWPFVEFPGSDPLPPGFGEIDSRFISQPIATLDGQLGEYLELLGPAPLLFVAALLIPLLVRSRPVAAASGVLALSLLIWMNAPFTGDSGGIAADLLAVSTVRYLMPSAVLATAILAVAASRGGRASPVAWAVLAIALTWGVADLAFGRDGLPPLWILIVGVASGAAVALAATRLGGGIPRGVRLGTLGLAGAIVLVALSAYPGRFLELYTVRADVDDPLTDTRELFGPLVRWFGNEPGFVGGDQQVLSEPTIVGPLAGGDLGHETGLFTDDADCSSVRDQAGGGYAVFRIPNPAFGEPPAAYACFAADEPRVSFPTAAGDELVVYEVPG